MKKRGFTLVELLAVIAILAILVIMALPAVLNMFTKARIDTFENEVRTIYRTAEQQYLLNQGEIKCFESAGNGNHLDMTGNEINYYILFSDSGKVTRLQADDGTYYYDSDDVDALAIDDINYDSTVTSVTYESCE